MKRGLVWSATLVLLGAVLLSAGGAAGQSAPAEGAAAKAAEEQPVREQSIYIPYKELRAVFEKEGRGVFLPYEEFIRLWRQSRENKLAPVDAAPPVDFLVSEAENVATVAAGSDVVAVRSQLKVEILKAGWHEVPLRLGDAAVTQAALGKEPARLMFDADKGYTLLLKKEGDKAETFTLDLEFAKAFTKAPGQNSVSFQSPQAPVSRWEIRIPDSGVKVDIDPMIAATELPAEGREAKGTTVLAFVGAAPTVRIGWTPKAEGATGLAALTTVEAAHRVSVDEGVVRTRVELVYTVSRAELPALEIEVPADQKVVAVADANVRQWSVMVPAQVGSPQVIGVQLFEPAAKSQRLVIELEKYDDKGEGPAARQVAVPLVKALGVIRQQGVVVVDVADELRAEAAERQGLIQLDAAELPRELGGGKWDFAYRYAALPYGLSLKVEKIQPRIVAESLVEARLQADELLVDTVAVYTIERSGVFQLTLRTDVAGDVRRVRGIAVAGAQPVQVDNYHLEDGKEARIVVDLGRKAIGRVALAVEMAYRLNEPDLLTPTGKKAEIALSVPRVHPATVERQSGWVVVSAPEIFRLSARTEGLRTVDVSKAYELTGGASPVPRGDGSLRPVMAYAFSDEAVKATLVAERRTPQVTVKQLLVARVETGIVKSTSTFTYDIRYGSVKSVRIDVPADLAASKKLRNVTRNVRDEEMDPQPEDVDAGYVAWQLTGEKEFAGQSQIVLEWETPIEKLDIGTSVDLDIPHLKPRDGRAEGRIVLAKAETIDLEAVDLTEALRPIDPEHDLEGVRVADAARAYEFHADWSLKVRATRYELEEVKRTSIERALVRMVVTRSGAASVQALYLMRSARQRLMVRLPAGVEFDRNPLRLNGQRVDLERGAPDSGEYFIPLVGQAADEPLRLELRYTVKDAGLGAPRLDCPTFPDEPAVQKVYLSVYLPDNRAWLGCAGPWTNEQRWTRCGLAFSHAPRLGDAALLQWAGFGAKVPGGADDGFQVDGKPHLFSALQPAAAPDGSLRIVSADRLWMHVILLAVILLGGLVLLRCSARARWLSLGGVVIVVVLLGMFFPTAARQVAGEATAGAVAIVLVLWGLRYLVVTLPRRRREHPRPPKPGAPLMVPATVPVAPAPAEPAPPAEEDALRPPGEVPPGAPPGGGKSQPPASGASGESAEKSEGGEGNA